MFWVYTAVASVLLLTLVSCLFQEVILRDSPTGWELGRDLDHFSSRTRQVLQYMNPNKINMDLLVELLDYLGTAVHVTSQAEQTTLFFVFRFYLRLNFGGFLFVCPY